MSVWIVSKADIDAYVTVALRWTERGDVARMPEPAASVLNVTRDGASQVGTRLWLANHNMFNFDGPPELGDPEWLASLDDEEIAVMPAYEFEEFPGVPVPETAFCRAGYYHYQTAGDYWDRDCYWPDGFPPFEALFTTTMAWHALVLLGLADPRHVLRFGRTPWDVDLRGFPKFDQSGWRLTEQDRDLFLRLT